MPASHRGIAPVSNAPEQTGSARNRRFKAAFIGLMKILPLALFILHFPAWKTVKNAFPNSIGQLLCGSHQAGTASRSVGLVKEAQLKLKKY